MGKPGSYHHGVDREGHIKPMTIGARLYRLENQVAQVDRKLDGMTNMLKALLAQQQQQHLQMQRRQQLKGEGFELEDD